MGIGMPKNNKQPNSTENNPKQPIACICTTQNKLNNLNVNENGNVNGKANGYVNVNNYLAFFKNRTFKYPIFINLSLKGYQWKELDKALRAERYITDGPLFDNAVPYGAA